MIHVNIWICPWFQGWLVDCYVTCDVTQKRGIFFLLMSHNLGDAKETMDWKSWPRNDHLRWEEFSDKCHFVVGQVYNIGVIHLLLDAHVTLLGISKTLVTDFFEFTMLGCQAYPQACQHQFFLLKCKPPKITIIIHEPAISRFQKYVVFWSISSLAIEGSQDPSKWRSSLWAPRKMYPSHISHAAFVVPCSVRWLPKTEISPRS